MTRAIIVLLALASCATRATIVPRGSPGDEWGAPLIVLTEPLGHVSDDGPPIFALYASGRVVYGDPYGFEDLSARIVPRYETVTLSPEEVRALLGGLDVRRVRLPRRYVQRGGFDGAESCLHTWPGGVHKRQCVWPSINLHDLGLLRPSDDFVRVWMKLSTFKSTRTTAWVPEHADVSLMPSEDCGHPEDAEPWPSAWPHAAALVALAKPNYATFRVPGEDVRVLRRMGERVGQRHCLRGTLLDGARVFPHATVPLPHEEMWFNDPPEPPELVDQAR